MPASFVNLIVSLSATKTQNEKNIRLLNSIMNKMHIKPKQKDFAMQQQDKV